MDTFASVEQMIIDQMDAQVKTLFKIKKNWKVITKKFISQQQYQQIMFAQTNHVEIFRAWVHPIHHLATYANVAKTTLDLNSVVVRNSLLFL